MSFEIFWKTLQEQLTVNTVIKNWTVVKGYLGDDFKIIAISSNTVKIDSPNAKTVQNVSKEDFKVMFDNWEDYCSKRLRRKELTELTRVSKYSMSIIKHFESL